MGVQKLMQSTNGESKAIRIRTNIWSKSMMHCTEKAEASICIMLPLDLCKTSATHDQRVQL